MYKFVLTTLLILIGNQGFSQDIGAETRTADIKMERIMKDCQNNPIFLTFGSSQHNRTNFSQMSKFVESMKPQDQIGFQIKMSAYLNESESCSDYIQRYELIISQLAIAQDAIDRVEKLLKPTQK